MLRRLATTLLLCFALASLVLLAACGSSNTPASGTNTPTAGTATPSGGSGGSGGTGGSGSGGSGSGGSGTSGGGASTAEHIVYALENQNQVFVFDAHPTQGTLQQIAGPIATTLVNGATIAFDAPQRVLFSAGFTCQPRGACGDNIAVLSTADPKAPALVHTQQADDIESMLIDASGLFPIAVNPVNAFTPFRYDPAAHSLTGVGFAQFQAGNGPSTFIHPGQKVVISVTTSGAANGPFTTYVTTFLRDTSSGALTKSATLTLNGSYGDAALTLDGRYLLVPNTDTGAVSIVAVDGSSGTLTLAGTSPSAGAFLLYRFLDATHVIGRLKVNNSDRLTVFTFNSGSMTVTPGATVDLAGSQFSIKNVGNTIYVGETNGVQMILFDPSSGSLRVAATVGGTATSIDVNPIVP